MTCRTNVTENPAGVPVVFIFILIVAVFFGVYSCARVYLTEHAKTSHSAQIPQIEKCFNGGGTISELYRMPNGRYAQYCAPEKDGKNVFWRIFSCEESGAKLVITQFKQNIRNWIRLENYINNKRMDLVPQGGGC